MDKAERVLKECIDDLLTEEIKTLPNDAELKKQHTFSKRFQKNMNRLIKENKRKNIYRMYKAFGACAAIVVLGFITVNLLSPNGEVEMSDVYENMTEETTESAMEETVDVPGISAKPVGLQVDAVREENGWELCLQIYNNSDKTIQFMEGSYMLEVWQEDGWYAMTTEEGTEMYELSPGGRYDTKIILEEELSREHTYRLLCMFDGEIKEYVFNVE